MTEVSVAGLPGSHALADKARQFARWWLNELRDCAPQALRHVLQARVETQVFVWSGNGTVSCRLVTPSGGQERCFQAGSPDGAQIGEWLAQCRREREAVQICVALEPDLFFQREFRLPRSEIGALKRILEQEIVHRTPFQPGDIWHGVTPDGSPNSGLAAFRHWIIPKDRAEAEIVRLGLEVGEVDFIGIRPATDVPIAVVPLREIRQDDPPWAMRAMRVLAAALLVATTAGLLGFEWWQSSRAAALEDELHEARRGVQQGQQEAGSPVRLLALKALPGSLAAWDELSRVIPDHTFLTELRIAGATVSLSGLSSDAARLVRVLEGSRLFTGATLLGSITPDAAEQRDRFNISLKLRKFGTGRVARSAERSGS